mgnify:FL=1
MKMEAAFQTMSLIEVENQLIAQRYNMRKEIHDTFNMNCFYISTGKRVVFDRQFFETYFGQSLTLYEVKSIIRKDKFTTKEIQKLYDVIVNSTIFFAS